MNPPTMINPAMKASPTIPHAPGVACIPTTSGPLITKASLRYAYHTAANPNNTRDDRDQAAQKELGDC